MKAEKRLLDQRYKVLLLGFAAVLALFAASRLLSPRLAPHKVEAETSFLERPIGTIAKNNGEVLVYENASKEMYLDTETTNIRIVDKQTGTEWETLATGAAVVGSDGLVSEAYSRFVSPFEIHCVDDDGVHRSMNAYNYSIRDGQFVLNQLEKGVQITYELQDKAIRVFEHLPRRIYFNRYEEFIAAPVENAFAAGLISERDYNNFTMFWDAFYSKNQDGGFYVYSVGSLPPASSIRLMIRVLDLAGYDQEQLIYDNQQFGESTVFELRTTFTVTIETMLDGDDLVVKIPTAYAKSNSDFDKIRSISVYPFFGNVHTEAVPKENPGFIFVPDGSGALIQLNNYNQNQPIYDRAVYKNDIYDQYYYAQDRAEDLVLPVFGMYLNQEDHWKGFLGLIERGAELAHIRASAANRASRSAANQVNAVFDLLQVSNVRLFGPYAQDTTSNLARSVNYDYNAVVRYKLLVGETLDYYDLAQVYRDYLMEQYGLEEQLIPYRPKVFLDLLGNVSIKKHFLGIPYQSHLSMTTFQEAGEILDELAGVDKVVNYCGVINQGINQSLLSRVEFAAANGSVSQFEQLQHRIADQGDQLFVQISLLKVYTQKNGFRPKMGMYALDSKPLRLIRFNLTNKRFDYSSSYYQILSPSYLPDLLERFVQKNAWFDAISLADLGSIYMVDYRRQNAVTPLQAGLIEQASLEQLSGYNLILDDPFIKNIPYADYVQNIGRRSSDFILFSSSIPFKQLVLNGLVEYCTESINIGTDQPQEYYLLQALELGSHPKFTLSYKDSSLLKDTEFNSFYSTNYRLWVDHIRAIYGEIAEAFQRIGTNEIVHHQMLAPAVYQTTYKGGTKVIVNYNDYAVETDEGALGALSYTIVGGGER